MKISEDNVAQLAINKAKSDMYYGAICITFAHEFAHFCQRSNFTTIKEMLEFTTPKSSLCSSLWEAGFDIEKELFGSKVKYLNDEAAAYLLESNFSGNFIARFQSLNIKKDPPYNVALGRFDAQNPYMIEIGGCDYTFGKYIHIARRVDNP